jgi:hypothetical protein
MPDGNDESNWEDAIRSAKALIWLVLILAVCGLLWVLNEVTGRPVSW